MFFNKKKKKNNEKEQDNTENIEEKVEKDLIVHNMPKEDSLQGKTSNPVSAGKVSVSNIDSSDKKSKLVGVLIIVGGLILISGLVFITYRYAISPVARDGNNQNNQNVVEEEQKEENNQEVQVEEEEEIIPDDEVEIEVPDKEEVATSSEEVEVEVEVAVLDSDDDGLTDKEEIILGTNLNVLDSDDDSYSDLQEVQNLYDPISSERLEDNENIETYVNDVYSLSFLYPNDWQIKNNENELFILETLKSSFVQLSISDNVDNQGILSWYETTFSQSNIDQDSIIDKDNFEGVIGRDGLNVYLTDSSREYIYVLSYTPGEEEGLAFENIFEMMINSLKTSDNSGE
ncbi:MAG: hypothetical protein PF488_02375 [Patescibacteria group bacterium]|jgi:hypothetical protein|nr:hypothetical protein [Patescibacteria group bacterium]